MSIEERNQPRPAPGAFPVVGPPADLLRREEPEQSPGTGKLVPQRLAALAILIAGAAVPAWLAAVPARPPQTRNIHIEAYRYGFNPSRIHANRGDRLRLTFSTRDTGQSFFFQDYDLHVSITPGDKRVSVQRLSRPDDPSTKMQTVEIVAGLPGWRGLLTSKSQFRNHTYNGPLHGTERGELIVAPNFLLYGGLGLLGGIPLAGLLLARRRNAGRAERRWNLFGLFPWLQRAAKAPSFQFNLALPMLGVFWFIILAGLLGTKVSGRNAGWDKRIASYGEAWQTIKMFALACLYSFVNFGAWDKIRDWIDIVDKRQWGTFSLYAVVVWAACLGVLPLLWYLLTRIGVAISKSSLASRIQFRVTTAALIPIGLACWIAFALATVLSMMTFVLQSLSDPFNWGWNLLGMAGSRWHILWSPAIAWLQVGCVLIGAACALQTLYLCWLDDRSDRHQAILGSLPLGSFVWIAAATMICFFAG
jgi:hypothetical protein